MKKIYIIFALLIAFIGLNNVNAASTQQCYCKKVSGGKCKYTWTCIKSDKVSCNKVDASKCALTYVACGSDVSASKCSGSGKGSYDIPIVIPKLTSFAVNALKIVTPIILIIVGMIELLKAVASTDEDSIKKAQGKLVKKMIIAVIIFMIIYIVQFVVAKVAEDDEKSSISSCFSCFLNNDCPLKYYRSGTNGDQCIPK